MPSLGADMEAGTLSRWCRKEGDAVKPGDVIAVVETDKGAIEVEIFASGTIVEIVVEEGQKVPVGTVLAVIEEEGAGAEPARGDAQAPALQAQPPEVQTLQARDPQAEAPQAQAPQAQVPQPAAPLTASAEPDRPRVHASPAARYRARELGVDLAAVRGSGPHGNIVRSDVEGAALGPVPSAMRRAIAAAMTRSNREIPHYYLSLAIDLHHALAWLGERNAARPLEGRVLPAALLLHAVARTLPRFPELNGTWGSDAAHPSKAVNLGVAVALRGGGVVNPCIQDAAALDLDGTMAALVALVARARSGRLRSSELADTTITVTNLGDLGVDETFGVIYPPQVALIGFGRIAPQPVAVGDMLAVHPVVRMTLAADHRASDGHQGGLFLTAVDRLLQEIA